MSKLKLDVVTTLILAAAWFAWPLYGFASNQFEAWRLPFGWHEIPAAVPTYSEVFDDDYAAAAEEALRALEARGQAVGLPSLSAAIAVDGRLVWAGGTGLRHVSDASAATADTAYRIGSTSKAVTATLLARLVADGTVGLDEPINAYVPELPRPDWGDVTLRQLASHTAGLPGYEENTDRIGYYRSLSLRGRLEDPCEATSLFDGSDLIGAPGETFTYTSFGTVLLACVLQEAAGRPYAALVRDEVASPLRLSSLVPDHATAASGTDRAVSYQARRRGASGVRDEPQITKVAPWRHVNLSQKLPGGGWTATPSDLALLGTAWLDDDYVSRTLREEFFTPVALADGSANPQDYALGWRRKAWPIEGIGDVVHLNHGGVSKGAQAWLMVLPEHDVALAIATNARTEDFFAFADIYVELLEAFLPQANANIRNGAIIDPS